jgi:hypothetical protein
MEVTATQILGWQRNVQGCTVVLDVDVGGTVRETLRLTLATNADVTALLNILTDAVRAAEGRGPQETTANAK